ncbi:MAG: TIGR03905 family TSCPD domain-containing protein [Lachnospiraceae bacterium]|nr:TIGR03905 family TSCPD domain-containing protein [Candidatus Equihabitans merdae]
MSIKLTHTPTKTSQSWTSPATSLTKGTCSQIISLDLDGDLVRNIKFMGGCDGNLKAIPVILEGWSVDQIEEKLTGINCGRRGTSCADQLAKAVRAAKVASEDPNYRSPMEDEDE